MDTNNPQRELHQVVQKFIGETSESYKIHYEQKVYLFHHPNELAKILEHLKKLKDSVNLSFPPNRVCFSYFDHEHIHRLLSKLFNLFYHFFYFFTVL